MGMAVRGALVGAALLVAGVPLGAPAQSHRAAATAVLSAAVAAPAPAAQGGPGVRAADAGTGARTVAGTAESPTCATGIVALTFDDGPARGLTAKLVDILRDRHVPATFFMVGSRVRTAPRAARLVARSGFTIGNHTWSHPHLTRLSSRLVRSELRRTTHELRSHGITPTELMRPPYGDINQRVRSVVHDLGLVPVLWNVDSADWRGGSARHIAATILRQLRPHRGNLVLQHDGVRNSPASVAAVPIVVRVARKRGYCFGRLGPHGAVLPPAPPGEVAPAARVAASPRLLGSPFGVATTPRGT